jgi:hypothetical protein
MKSGARLFVLIASLGDAVTGGMLLAAPRFTLALMHVRDPLTEPAWMRWIGAFVLAVGLVPLEGLRREPRGGARLAHFVEATALVRAVIAAFTGAAVASGALSPAWLSVTACDAIVSVVQYWLVRRGALEHG